MLFDKRKPGKGNPRQRRMNPLRLENLEDRVLLAIDLGGVQPPSSPVATSPLPTIATFPYGIDMAGGVSSGGAGWSVRDVGDLLGNGYDDFVVGAPDVVNNGGQIGLGAGNNATAYLIFGSQSVSAGTISWLLNTTQGRVGDLLQLGNSAAAQQNPINGVSGFPFAGIKFITSQENGSQLGASVAALGAIHGTPAFMLGAPGGVNSAGTGQAGRAFLIYGGPGLLSHSGQTIDLDNPNGNQGVTFVTYVSNATGAMVGASVAGPGDVFGDGSGDIAIGAPGATYDGNSGAGVAFLIDGFAAPTTTSTVLIDRVGQNGGPRGVIFGGTASGDQTGMAVAGAGSFDGSLSSSNTRIPDFLIGAPGASTVYLVYGGGALISDATSVGGLISINLDRLGAPGTATDTVVGATIAGEPGDGTGMTIATAGDFNADGLDDFMIGSPFFNANQGRVTLFYGQAATSNNLVGTISLDAIPANDPSVQLTGAGGGALAGWSLSEVGRINLTQAPNPILIGSPGANGNNGLVYLIPGNLALTGIFSLTNAQSQPIAATVFTLTTPGEAAPPFLGASVSGIVVPTGVTNLTADGDGIADFIIGAPGYAATGQRGLDGGVMILEGKFVPLQTPTSNAINTTISVDAPESVSPPYPVNATTPNSMLIYVESTTSTTPAFDPVKDINPATIVVNGVAFPNATIAKDPVDENNDGVEDAIITISPRSNLGLTNNTTSLTITGRTLASSPLPNKVFTGTTTITVSGAPVNGGGGGVGTIAPIGAIALTFFQPPFGADQFVPPPSTLSTFDYKPIPKRVAYHQFLPDLGFQMRILNYTDPARYHFQPKRTNSGPNGRAFTHKQHFFDTSVYHPGKLVVANHKAPVIPVQEQHQILTPRHK